MIISALAIVILIGFILLSVVHVIGEFLAEGLKLKIRTITKPFLMPLVVIYYLIAASDLGITPNTLIIIALLLGWVGDVVLMKPKVQILFMIGLGSFLIGHLLYIIAFAQASNGLAEVPWWIYLTLIGFVAFWLLVFKFLQASLKEMKVPVAVYMAIILTMCFFSLGVLVSPIQGEVRNAILLLIGSFNFIASDFFLANQLFKKAFKYDQALIMVTYIVAQFLIAQAYLF